MIKKITTENECNNYIKELGFDRYYLTSSVKNNFWCKSPFNAEAAHTVSWWAKREYARIDANVYQTTSILEYLNSHFPIFSHISLDDPKMVAFTPDAHCGENDKQIRISIGKLISKYLPVITQDCLQNMIKEHESELNPEILWASGQELTDIYINDMGNLGACMSKSHWEVHPTVAYHTDEIRMAYMKKENTIIARTLVYEPKDKSKKVFIRMYPRGHALEKHLGNLGYEAGDFVGAKLNTVNIKENKYAIPYLDGNNGPATNSSSTTALIDNQLTVVSSRIREKISLVYPGEAYRTVIYTADGYARYRNINSNDFNKVCSISGETYSLLDDVDVVNVWFDGKVCTALHKNVNFLWVKAKTFLRQECYVDPILTFIVENNQVITTKEELIEAGYALLDKELYPHETENWSKRYEKTHNGKYIKFMDSVTAYHYDGKTYKAVTYHNSEVKPKQFLKMADGQFCTKDSKYLVTTSRKRVIPGLQSFYSLVDGTYTIRKPNAYLCAYGINYYGNSYQELEKYIKDNEEKLFTDYFMKIISSSRYSYIAQDLLDYGNPVRTVLCRGQYSAEVFLTKLVSGLKVGSIERKVIGNYLAEITAIEY